MSGGAGMMGGAVLLAALLVVAVMAARRVARGETVFPLVILAAGLGMGAVLAVVDRAGTYTWGGDDRAYVLASQVQLHGAAWLDFNQFQGFAQGGYPLVLAWVYQAAGASTFVYKAVNLFFYLLLVVLWFRIGQELGGRRTAWACAVAMLVGTPLWMYWMFVLKDMIVILLQSVFLLGAARLGSGRGGMRAWLPVFAGTVLLVPFRVFLVLLHAAVTVTTAVLAGRQSGRRKAALLLGTAALVAAVVSVGGNKRALSAFGAVGSNQTLDYETVRDVSGRYADARKKFSGPAGMVMFPLAYVFGETSGLNPEFMGLGVGDQVRPDLLASGLGALPWIFVGSPLFAYALWHMVRNRRGARRSQAPPPWTAVPAARPILVPSGPPGQVEVRGGSAGVAVLPAPPPALATTPVAAPAAAPVPAEGEVARGWMPLLLFLLSYVVVAWLVEDTTRWRMPAFPVMAAMAAQAWLWLRPRGRILLVGGWATSLAVLFTLYYGVLK